MLVEIKTTDTTITRSTYSVIATISPVILLLIFICMAGMFLFTTGSNAMLLLLYNRQHIRYGRGRIKQKNPEKE
jgi:hypothetical protein